MYTLSVKPASVYNLSEWSKRINYLKDVTYCYLYLHLQNNIKIYAINYDDGDDDDDI